MKFLLLLTLMAFTTCQGMKNYFGTDLQKCLNCVCHARSGCYSRINCARYSISIDYWKTAKSPVVDENEEETEEERYQKCMKNENCILTTLDQYADAIGHMDCNCDGQFDCKDRLAIHLYGSECTNPKFSSTYATRFNSCSRNLGVKAMLAEEGFEGCSPEVF